MSCDDGLALVVNDVGKCYRLYERPQDRLKQGFFRRRKYYREFWALRGASFSIRKGECVGIVGRNGSGKSTLLQIIAGTVTPTTGTVHTMGPVSALLELGSGFNPDFTGRENVFVNGAILGLSRTEVERHFDAIAEFADIGPFIDQPVRSYSSGMAVRLAFAVQAFLPKEILIVDEVLAVGDEAFQRKCFGQIEAFRERGGTILLVSHNSELILQFCDRAMLVDHGEILLQGRSKHVNHLYHRLAYAPSQSQEHVRAQIAALGARPDWERRLESAEEAEEETARGRARGLDRFEAPPSASYDEKLVSEPVVRYESRGARIQQVGLYSEEGALVNLLTPGEAYLWRYAVTFDERLRDVRFGMLVKTVSGIELGGAVSASPRQGIPRVEAGTTANVSFRFRAGLSSGTYFLNAGVVAALADGDAFADRWVDAFMFKVISEQTRLVTGWVDFGATCRITVGGASEVDAKDPMLASPSALGSDEEPARLSPVSRSQRELS